MGQPLETPATALQFSFEALPSEGKLPALADFLAEMMRAEVNAVSDALFTYTSGLRVLPGVSWGSARSSALVTTRTRQLTRDGQDDLMLVMPDVDMIIRAPGRGELLVRPGEALLMSQAREVQIITRKTMQSWAVRVPHRILAGLVPGLSAAPLVVLRQDTPMLSLLLRYGQMVENEVLAGPAEQELVALQLQQMLAVVIGASPDLRDEAEAGSVALARLQTIEADILEHLGNTNLSLNWLAARHGISSRHLQRLLAGRGMSFSDLVGDSRLKKARRLLEDARLAHRSIVSIALECGFPEASALNRSFRRAYGMTPSDARAMALEKSETEKRPTR